MNRFSLPFLTLLLAASMGMGCTAASNQPANQADSILIERSATSEANHRAACEKLFALLDMQKVMDAGIDLGLKAQLQANPQLAPMEEVLRAFLTEHMSWNALHEDFVQLYMEHFTQQELEEMAAFHSTPTGQKANRLIPEMMRRGAELGQQRVAANLDDLRRRVEAQSAGK